MFYTVLAMVLPHNVAVVSFKTLGIKDRTTKPLGLNFSAEGLSRVSTSMIESPGPPTCRVVTVACFLQRSNQLSQFDLVIIGCKCCNEKHKPTEPLTTKTILGTIYVLSPNAIYPRSAVLLRSGDCDSCSRHGVSALKDRRLWLFLPSPSVLPITPPVVSPKPAGACPLLSQYVLLPDFLRKLVTDYLALSGLPSGWPEGAYDSRHIRDCVDLYHTPSPIERS